MLWCQRRRRGWASALNWEAGTAPASLLSLALRVPELVGFSRFAPHFRAVARTLGQEVTAGAHLDRVHKMLVQMIYVLNEPAFHRSADGEVVEGAEVLDVFA